MSPCHLRNRTKQRVTGKRSKKKVAKKVVSSKRLPASFSSFFLIALIIVSGVWYLFSVNSRATKGYELVALEDRIGQLQESQRKLTVEASELNSLARVEELSASFGLVEAQEVDYVVHKDSSVARR